MAAEQILVDTTILIDHFRKKNKRNTLLWRLTASKNELLISVITEFEFYCGCKGEERLNEAKDLLNSFKKIIFASSHSVEAGKVYNELRIKNQLIGIPDILIGGVARHESLPVATINQEHFHRIDGLEIVDIHL